MVYIALLQVIIIVSYLNVLPQMLHSKAENNISTLETFIATSSFVENIYVYDTKHFDLMIYLPADVLLNRTSVMILSSNN